MKVVPNCAGCDVGAAGVLGAALADHSETGVAVPTTADVLKTASTQKLVAEAPEAGNPLDPD